MNKFFINKAKSIYEVAKEQKVDIDVAFLMVKADVVNGVSSNAKRKDIDFTALKAQWDDMSGDEQGDAIDAWGEFYRSNFKALAAAWTSGDSEAFQAIIDNA